MTPAELARFLFDRQAATYNTDTTYTTQVWESNPGVRDFWTGEAAAILTYIGARWGDLA